MPDEVVDQVESKASAEVQAEAHKLGWIPPARFKGDPSRFVDADTYIERGETVLPIVKEQNKRLHAQLTEQSTQLRKLEEALTTATKAIGDLEEKNTVDRQRALDDAKAQLKAQLAQASEDGDHALIAELTGKMVEVQATQVAVPKVEPARTPPAFVAPPELKEWNAENPWYGTDRRRTSLALGIAQELKDAGETATGRAFLDLVAAEVEVTLGGKTTPSASKVEGAGRSGEEPRGSGGKKGYAALPAEAKAACDVDLKKFVGAGKRYKTAAEWQAQYATLYFS